MNANQFTPLGERVWSRVRVLVEAPNCWEWVGPYTRSGYARIRVNNKDTRVHRVVWQMLKGPIPAGLHVLHSCDNRRCVRIDHLRLGTHQDNMRDMKERKRYAGWRKGCRHAHPASGDRHGTHTKPETVRRGEGVALSKLTADKVREIRARRAAGETIVSLGLAFGVTHNAISAICRRATWKHVD
jgi:hypothetical protein